MGLGFQKKYCINIMAITQKVQGNQTSYGMFPRAYDLDCCEGVHATFLEHYSQSGNQGHLLNPLLALLGVFGSQGGYK